MFFFDDRLFEQFPGLFNLLLFTFRLIHSAFTLFSQVFLYINVLLLYIYFTCLSVVCLFVETSDPIRTKFAVISHMTG